MKTSTLFHIPTVGDISEAERLRNKAKESLHMASFLRMSGKTFMQTDACLSLAKAFELERKQEDLLSTQELLCDIVREPVPEYLVEIVERLIFRVRSLEAQ